MRFAHRFARTSLAANSLWLAALLCTHGAQAQVNKCRVDGQLLYRSAPCPLEPRAATAGNTASAPKASKKKTLADLLRERDGAQPARPVVQEFQGDGANVLRSRMGAS
ncbi:MAG: hypothetical protein ABI702_04535 [Burkholderiales bacterium]